MNLHSILLGVLAQMIAFTAFTAEKSLGGSLHGKLSVEYLVLADGRHVLKLKENSKALEVLDLKIRDGESLSLYNGSFCTDEHGAEVYAVMKTRPLRAWAVDQKRKQFKVVESRIQCKSEDIGH